MLIFTSSTYQKFYTEKILKKEYKPSVKEIKQEVKKINKIENDKKEEKEDVVISKEDRLGPAGGRQGKRIHP